MSGKESSKKRDDHNKDKQKSSDIQERDSEANEDISEEVSEALEEMPPKMRRHITMAMMQQTSTRGIIGHPLFEKFNEKHIDKFLDYSQRDDDNEFKYKSTNRWFYLLYSILGISLFVFLVIFLLPNDRELLIDIFKLIIVFGGGLGSGYGLKSLRR